jgi:hypothetical protein
MIRSGKSKKKASTADAAGGNFSNDDPVMSLLNAISGSKAARIKLSQILASNPTANIPPATQDDDFDQSLSDPESESISDEVNEITKSISHVQLQIAEIDIQLSHHAAYSAKLPPNLRGTEKSAKAKLLSNRETLESLLLMKQDKLESLKSALASTSVPKSKSKNSRHSKKPTHDEG